MGYKLKADENLSTGIKRITCEEIDRASEQLSGQTDKSSDEAVHDARKRFKKIRAVLRLVRDRLGQEIYNHENACFRDAGKFIADVRDTQVNLETLDKINKYFSESVSEDLWTDLRQILEAYYHSVRKQLLERENNVEAVLTSIKAAKERVESWSIEGDDWTVVSKGLKRVYSCLSINQNLLKIIAN